jgi:hypothetical protein
LIRDLGDGLVLRRSTPADSQALADFNARVHSDDGLDKPDERLAVWTRDLLEKPHPTFDTRDFTIVEDTEKGDIVSSMNLIPQTWRYAGIPFPVGRPELVGTHPDYRHRGLVRAQFEVIHQWSADRGHMLQAITGIPYYYRLFGYEMAVNLGGGRAGFPPDVPKLKDGESEPCQVRPATEEDIPFITTLYRQAGRRYLLTCDWDEAMWRYELKGKTQKNANKIEVRMIEALDGEPIGFLAHWPDLWKKSLNIRMYELKVGVSWGSITPSVARYIYKTGAELAKRKKSGDEFGIFGFNLGAQHPAYDVMHKALPRRHKPYAWYLRVPDVPAFITHIIPALEQRLAGSPYVGHTGELKLTFYRTGVRLSIKDGLLSVEPWKPDPFGHSGDAGFPGLTFLQLLFGYRSLDELTHAFADCWWERDETFGLLSALFPKQHSDIHPVS